MKLLGIDYGMKRVGIALSDEAGLMGFPHVVLKNDSNLFQSICTIIKEYEVEEIVIGHSFNKAGGTNKVHDNVTELVTDLTLEVGLPVHLEPEQYTTQEAVRFQGHTDKTDAAAASIILNSYITKKK